MHRAVLAVAAWAVVAVLATPTDAMSVWPKPQQQTFGQTTHTINPESFDIAATGGCVGAAAQQRIVVRSAAQCWA